MAGGARYSRWDGTQHGFDFDADAVMGELGDDLIHHGDPNAALRRLLQSGFRDRGGREVEGVRSLLDRLRRRRRQRLEHHDLGGAYAEVAERLRDVVDTERSAIDDVERAAGESGDLRRAELTGEAAAERRLQLDLLPPDLAGQVQALSAYDFVSPEAREAFEQLVGELRQELAQSWLDRVAAGG
ncbi:MAG TPA: hypothetical protein VGV63_12345, partial [Acidimicrobiales bacterium]|nr:hypothetical protein [Acidimicrobiales bacterium]